MTRPIKNEARFGLPGMFVVIDEENMTNVFGMDMRKMFCDAGFCPLPFESTSFKKSKPFKCSCRFSDAPFR